MSNSGPKPLLILIIALQILFCLVVYLTCGCIRRRRQRRHHGLRTSTALQPGPVLGPYPMKSEVPACGLDPAMVDSFPIIPCSVLKEPAKAGAESCGPTLECAVCLSSFREDQTLRFIPKCEHVFHPDCVDPWLRHHSTCPYCRADLGPGHEDEDEPDSVVIVVVTENNDERYTLRLSDEVWRRIMNENMIRHSDEGGRLDGEWSPPMGRRGGDEETLSVSEST